MPKDELSKTDNSEDGKRLRRERLLKSQLVNLGLEMHPLYQEVHRLQFYESEEWDVFFVKLRNIINKLFLLKPFNNNETLQKECEEILVLLNNEDKSQWKRYIDIVEQLYSFLYQLNAK